MTRSRFLLGLSAGLVTAGVSMAMLAGVGFAVADDGSGAASGTSSESSNSTGKKPDSEDGSKPDSKNDDKTDEPAGAADPSGNDAGIEDQEPADEVPEGSAPPDKDKPPVDDTAKEETPKKGSDHSDHKETEPSSNEIDKPATTAEVKTAEVKKDTAENAAEPVADTKDPEVPAAETGPVDKAVAAAKAKETPVTTALAFAAAEPAATPAGPSLINVIGTFFWGLFDLASKLVDLPPVVPPGSTVTAGRSTLQIDCGDGYTADADWYFPTEGEPDKFIYFQHGFPGRAGFYNLTLAELAERNNAIVVAPSITANIFACDGCRLMGDPMHAAVARLFEGDRSALLASAQAAGYEGALPEQFVISGQSAGGIHAVGTAGYFQEFAPADEKANMVGVLLFDTAEGGVLDRALDKIPTTIPVLHIAAEPHPINIYGNANQTLVEKRPGQFNGIQLVGGTHGDAFRSSALFGIPQFVVSAALGFPTQENVEAVQVLSEGWITDMYEGRVYDPATRTGIYGDPGEPGEVLIDIPTDAGVARGYVLPGPTPRLSLIELFIATLINSPASIRFDVCAEDPSAAATATCSTAVPQAPLKAMS